MMPADRLFPPRIASPTPAIPPPESPPRFPVTRAFHSSALAAALPSVTTPKGNYRRQATPFSGRTITPRLPDDTPSSSAARSGARSSTNSCTTTSTACTVSPTAGPKTRWRRTRIMPAYPNYFLGIPTTYSQGAAQGENDRNTSVALFAQDSFKLKSELDLELRPALGTQHSVLRYRQSPADFPARTDHTQYPCDLNPNNVSSAYFDFRVRQHRLQPDGTSQCRFPHGLGVSGRQGCSARFDFHLLQIFRSSHRHRLGAVLDRWHPGEDRRRSRTS